MRNKIIYVSLVIFFAVTACTGGAGDSQALLEETGIITTINIVDKIETTGNLGADQMMSLTWQTTGLIDKLYVEPGQKVSRGDILASLNPGTVSAEIVVAQADLATAKRDLQNLTESSTALAEAQLEVIKARKAVEVAQNIYEGLNYPRASDVLIKNTQAKIREAEKTVTLTTRRYKEVRNHPDGDSQKTEALLNMTNAQMKLNELISLYNWYTGKPTQSDFEEAKIKLEIARAALDDARRKRDNIKSGTDPLVVDAARAKVDAAQARVDAMYIIAPFDGEIISLWAKPGDSAAVGKLAIEIANLNTMSVETTVGESEVSAISVGDRAEISIDSLPDTKLTGYVSKISRIGKLVNGLVNFSVVVSLDPTDQPLLFGATTTVTLITGEPHDMLAAPVGAIQIDSAGEFVVIITPDGQMQRVDIKSSTISDGLVTIQPNAALKEGDVVQIKAPELEPAFDMGIGG